MNNGFVLINKPSGPTSHDIVDRVRRIYHTRAVGHAGTLDPFASGLLILGVGRATKKLSQIQESSKKYSGEIIFGATSITDDPEGEITKTNAPLPERADVEAVCKKFIGEIEQVPPMFSAKKIHGKKLYNLARAGITVERMPVKVKIIDLQITGYKDGKAGFEVEVSKGTYIRALARDIGQALKVGAYLKTLRREAIGLCNLDDAVSLEELEREPGRYLHNPIKCANLKAD